MKKTLALILTLALSLAALTGCGSKTETPADTNTDSSAQTETPAEAALSGSVSTNGSTSMEKVIGALSEQFMADNSGVTVTYDPTGSGAGIEAASNGSYAIQRPFVLVTKTGETLSPAAQAFCDYATASTASQLIKAAGAVPVAK